MKNLYSLAVHSERIYLHLQNHQFSLYLDLKLLKNQPSPSLHPLKANLNQFSQPLSQSSPKRCKRLLSQSFLQSKSCVWSMIG
jgi:hypothetical protein